MPTRSTQLPLQGHRAFAILDVVAGLVLIGVVAGILLVTLHRLSRINQHLADQRAAALRLELALVDLSLGRSIPADIQVSPLRSDTATAGSAPDMKWVRVSVKLGTNRQLSLDGPVPVRSDPPGGAP